MSRAYGEVFVRALGGRAMPGVAVDILDLNTDVRIPETVYADDTGVLTISLPTVTDSSGKVPFYLDVGQTVRARATVNGVTYDDIIVVDDPLGGGIAAGAATGPALGADVLTTGSAQAKTGSLTVPLTDKGGQVYNVAAYGVVGDGTTDCSGPLTTLLAALGRNVVLYFPQPPAYYKFNSTVNVPRANDYVRFLGGGPGRYSTRPNTGGAVILRRNFNGPIFTVESFGNEFDHLAFDGDSVGGHTGDLFQITTAPAGVWVTNCGFFDIDTYGIAFTTPGGGAKTIIESCTFFPKAAGALAGILLPADNTLAGDRLIANCAGMGSIKLADLSDAVNTNFTGCTGTGFLFGAESKKATITGCRMALVGGTLTVHGNQHVIVGCTINGGTSITLDTDATDCQLGPNSIPWSSPPTILDLGLRNRVLDVGYAQGGSVVLSTGGTIAVTAIEVARAAPAAAVTGVILGVGTRPAQKITVINEGAGASSITFAAAGTSHVALGAGAIIAGLTSRRFVWDDATSLWY